MRLLFVYNYACVHISFLLKQIIIFFLQTFGFSFVRSQFPLRSFFPLRGRTSEGSGLLRKLINFTLRLDFEGIFFLLTWDHEVFLMRVSKWGSTAFVFFPSLSNTMTENVTILLLWLAKSYLLVILGEILKMAQHVFSFLFNRGPWCEEAEELLV